MARYVGDYQDVSGHGGPARGMDPNYLGHYGGMRMGGGPGQAEYGRYRMRHPRDYDGAGGPFGRYDRDLQYTGEYEAGYDRPRGGGYDRGWRGGVRDLRRDRETMRGFNANSPALRPGGYDREQRGGGRYDRDLSRGRGFWQEYANRGIGSGGYAEGPPRWGRGGDRG